MKIVVGNGFERKACFNAIRADFYNEISREFKLEIQVVPHIPKTDSGKYVTIYSKVNDVVTIS